MNLRGLTGDDRVARSKIHRAGGCFGACVGGGGRDVRTTSGRARRPWPARRDYPRAASDCCPRSGPRCAAAPARNPREMPAADPIPASGGWVGVISAILVALGRRPLGECRLPIGTGSFADGAVAVAFRATDRITRAADPPRLAPTPASSKPRPITPVQTVAGLARCATSRCRQTGGTRMSRPRAPSGQRHRHVDDQGCRHRSQLGGQDHRRPCGHHPESLAASPDSSRLYVADRNAAAIRVIDIREGSPTRNRVVDSLRLEGSLPVGYGMPAAITLSPNGSRLYALMTDSDPIPRCSSLIPIHACLTGTVSGGDSIAMFSAGERIYVCADDRLGHTNVTAGW